MQFSVVINTYNRAQSLGETLLSLRYLQDAEFEVVVVNGPSTDHTDEVLEQYADSIRVGTCADRNLSVSRNVGIEMARGDVVAFLDDDAIPDASWLCDLAAGYDSEDVGGVGGRTIDHTGKRLQYGFTRVSRFGDASWDQQESLGEYTYPGCEYFPYLQGTNASFRKEVLLQVGGFDEEYDYYLDETDVCLRVVDAGYRLRELDAGFVYHRSLPSHIRNPARAVSNWRPIVKNRVYFALRHASAHGIFAVLDNCRGFVEHVKQDLAQQTAAGRLDEVTRAASEEQIEAAFAQGLRRGLSGEARLLGSAAAQDRRGETAQNVGPAATAAFKPYPLLAPDGGRFHICLVSQEYPPGPVGGIGRMTVEMAQGLAAAGHRVHVVTRSNHEHETIDFEQGVWVHRLLRGAERSRPPRGVRVPQEIWDWSCRVYDEVAQIHEQRPLDLVDAPIWDSEGLATTLSGRFRCVVSLETPLREALRTNPSWTDGSIEQRRFFDELMAAEKLTIERSTHIRAISSAIADSVFEGYDIQAPRDRVRVVPLGINVLSAPPTSPRKDRNTVDILFVGRFEERKGIDVLLDVIPDILNAYPHARFTLAGSGAEPWKERFSRDHAWHAGRGAVRFPGRLSDADLLRLYADCDIFAAPSRYESFGLVLLEAMRFGKPVIGCRAGGMVEIVDDGKTGLLATPGDAPSLQEALERLIADDFLRQRMGAAGRSRYMRLFTRDAMLDRLLGFYREVMDQPREARALTA